MCLLGSPEDAPQIVNETSSSVKLLKRCHLHMLNEIFVLIKQTLKHYFYSLSQMYFSVTTNISLLETLFHCGLDTKQNNKF